MRKVTITIEVELPDWHEWAAVDSSGNVYTYRDKPTVCDGHFSPSRQGINECKFAAIANWKETLTRFEGDDK